MGQPVVHFEIGCGNSTTTTEFYARLFDWKMEPYGPASMISTGASAGKLGGKTLVPPTDVPGMGRFAWLADPEGTIVGLWKPAHA